MKIKEINNITIDVSDMNIIELWDEIYSDDSKGEIDEKRKAIIFRDKKSGKETQTLEIKMRASQFEYLKSLFELKEPSNE